jgi:hypothetical protein
MVLGVLGGVFLVGLLAALPRVEPREARPGLPQAPVRFAQESAEGCWEPDDQPADPVSPLLRAIMDCHEELGLSEAQLDRLDDLANEFFRSTSGRQRALVSAQLALVDIMRADPRDPARPADVVAAEARIREIARLQAEQDLALLRVIEASKSVLDRAQRGRLAGLMRGMQTSRPATPQQSL